MTQLALDLGRFLDESPDAVLVIDAHDTVVYASRRVEEVFGHPPQALVGQSANRLIPQRFQADRARLRHGLLSNENPEWAGVDHEHFGLHRAGHEFPVAVRLALSESHGAKYLISTVRDTSVRSLRTASLPSILEASINEIYVFDAHTLRFLDVNLAARRNLGYTMQELHELTAVDIKPLVSREAFDALVAELLTQEGKSRVFHTEHQRKNGTRYPVEVHLQYTHMAGRAIFLAVILDITERLEAEQRLRESEERFREMTQGLPFIVWVHDAKGAQEFVNQTFCDTFGVRMEDLGTDRWKVLIHPDDEERYVSEFMRCVMARTPFHASCRVRVASGAWRRFESFAKPRFTAAGEFRGLIGGGVDVTERDEAEAAMKASEERFRALITATAAVVWSTDADGAFVSSQPSWSGYTGQTSADLAGLGWLEALHPDDRAHILSAWSAALAQRGPRIYTSSGRLWHAASNSWRRFETRGVPILEADGAVREWIGMILDTEDKGLLQDERERLNAHLLEADRRKNEFIATLAHELRNPLAPIRSGVDLLKQRQGQYPELDRLAPMLDRQVGQMVRLIDDLMDLSRITLGKLVLQRAPMDLVVAAQSAMEAVRGASDLAGHALNATLPETPVMVHGDQVRLIQVMSNLLSNAIKFTDPGGRIGLCLEQTAGEAVIRVQDNGIGIPPDQQARLFTMFGQIVNETRLQSGLGIGLALSKLVIEQHGGSISMRSDGKNRGSEFTVRLPLAAAASPVAASNASRELNTMPQTNAGTCFKILIVDDNNDAATSLATVLELLGHTVKAVFNGTAAIASVASFQPDVVLLDLGMPGMDGYQTARAIRDISPEAKTLLIALTGWGQMEDRQRTLNAGFDAHLVKPVEIEKLSALIEKLAQRIA